MRCTTIRALHGAASRVVASQRLKCCAFMSTTARLDHADLTASEPREAGIHDASITALRYDHSGLVRILTLRSPDHVVYEAGQWVDMFIPDVPVVGGFSITTAPRIQPAACAAMRPSGESCECDHHGSPEHRHSFELAVKIAKHPPAAWIHNAATLGSAVRIRVGGGFTPAACGFESPTLGVNAHIILVAGGVGINPLWSMLQALAGGCARTAPGCSVGRITLIHSVREGSQLLFADRVCALARWSGTHGGPSVRALYALTRADARAAAEESVVQEVKRTFGQDAVLFDRVHGRGRDVIGDEIRRAGLSNVHVCICGPPGMTDAVAAHVRGTHTSEDKVHFEKWW